jgi:hypothetical protein
MKIINITTQEEFDALPDAFDEYTQINIRSKANVWITVNKAWESSHVVARESSHVEAWESSHVVARGSSHVVAWESSHVVAWESSHVEARESSHVVAWESSHVMARESSHVVAWESSHVEAWESSHVEAWGSSHVVARGSSHVEARGSSHVEAWGSSHVEAWGSSHVEAWGNCSVKVQGSNSVKITLRDYAVCNAIACEPKLIECDETAHYIKSPVAVNDLESFLRIYKDNIQPDGRILLYKMVKADGTDHYSGTIKYEGTVICPDWDPDPLVQCGGGLHLSPSASLAKFYHPTGKLLKCLAHPDDIVVYGPDITKVRCRKVEVIDETASR